jgi:hypothetical protein
MRPARRKSPADALVLRGVCRSAVVWVMWVSDRADRCGAADWAAVSKLRSVRGGGSLGRPDGEIAAVPGRDRRTKIVPKSGRRRRCARTGSVLLWEVLG